MVLGAKIFAFADSVDEALLVLIRHDGNMILGMDVPLKALIEISSLFTIVITSTTTTERRLMIDLQAAREAFCRRYIAEIGWIEKEKNVAGVLIKTAQ